MAADSEILREYLVSLGYVVNTASQRHFNTNLLASNRNLMRFGASVTGIVSTVAAAETAFAYSMRRMYYKADLAGSSAQKFAAFGYAGKQIGLFDGQLQQATETMARIMDLSPGTKSFVESYIGNIKPGKMDEALLDFIEAINKQYPDTYIGAQMASKIGVDADTYRLMIKNIAKLRESLKEQKKLTDSYGLTNKKLEELNENSLEYTKTLDLWQEKLRILGLTLQTKFLPEFRELSDWVDGNIDKFEKWALSSDSVYDALKPIYDLIIGNDLKEIRRFLDDLGIDYSEINQFFDNIYPEAKSAEPSAPKKSKGGLEKNKGKIKEAVDFFESKGWTHEAAVGIVANLWEESNLNPKAFNAKEGAMGIAQWRNKRIREFPGDLKKASLREQLEYVHAELSGGTSDIGAATAGKHLKGIHDKRKAAGIVSNYFERPADRFGAEKTRAGVADEIDRILGSQSSSKVTINQKNEYNITGSDPQSTSKMVAANQERVNQDLLRNLRGAVI